MSDKQKNEMQRFADWLCGSGHSFDTADEFIEILNIYDSEASTRAVSFQTVEKLDDLNAILNKPLDVADINLLRTQLPELINKLRVNHVDIFGENPWA